MFGPNSPITLEKMELQARKQHKHTFFAKPISAGPSGRRQRLDDLPPMRLSDSLARPRGGRGFSTLASQDPYTLLSEFIFLDVLGAQLPELTPAQFSHSPG